MQLTLTQYAQYKNVDRVTVWRWLRVGLIKAEKKGRNKFITIKG